MRVRSLGLDAEAVASRAHRFDHVIIAAKFSSQAMDMKAGNAAVRPKRFMQRLGNKLAIGDGNAGRSGQSRKNREFRRGKGHRPPVDRDLSRAGVDNQRAKIPVLRTFGAARPEADPHIVSSRRMAPPAHSRASHQKKPTMKRLKNEVFGANLDCARRIFVRSMPADDDPGDECFVMHSAHVVQGCLLHRAPIEKDQVRRFALHARNGVSELNIPTDHPAMQHQKVAELLASGLAFPHHEGIGCRTRRQYQSSVQRNPHDLDETDRNETPRQRLMTLMRRRVNTTHLTIKRVCDRGAPKSLQALLSRVFTWPTATIG
jgi:hypothetical protein